jgi:hypothetical protein
VPYGVLALFQYNSCSTVADYLTAHFAAANCTMYRTLHVDPSNVKALSRRATARVAIGDKATALSDLKLVSAVV